MYLLFHSLVSIQGFSLERDVKNKRQPITLIATVKKHTACPEGSSRFMGSTILNIIWRSFFSWHFILPEDGL